MGWWLDSYQSHSLWSRMRPRSTTHCWNWPHNGQEMSPRLWRYASAWDTLRRTNALTSNSSMFWSSYVYRLVSIFSIRITGKRKLPYIYTPRDWTTPGRCSFDHINHHPPPSCCSTGRLVFEQDLVKTFGGAHSAIPLHPIRVRISTPTEFGVGKHHVRNELV